jgi:adenosyl cobinamide kinase/adenosyl cobinamide phosphate guanylyltransferase
MHIIKWLRAKRINSLQKRSDYHWNMNALYVTIEQPSKALKHGRKAVLLDCKINKLQGGKKQ